MVVVLCLVYEGCFPGALVVKNVSANAEDVGSIPGLGRSPGGGHGNPFQYFCLVNLMDRGAWWVTVRSVAKSRTRLKRLSMHACTHLWGRIVKKSEDDDTALQSIVEISYCYIKGAVSVCFCFTLIATGGLTKETFHKEESPLLKWKE